MNHNSSFTCIGASNQCSCIKSGTKPRPTKMKNCPFSHLRICKVLRQINGKIVFRSLLKFRIQLCSPKEKKIII